MRSNPDLIDRVLGQLESDNPNTRSIACEKAITMLAGEKLTFRILYASHRTLQQEREQRAEAQRLKEQAVREQTAREEAARQQKARDQAAEAARAKSAPPPPPPPPPTPKTTAKIFGSRWKPKPKDRGTQYAKADGTARFTHRPRVSILGHLLRRSGGKRVVRGKPPEGTVGILHILRDRIIGKDAYGPHHEMVMSLETPDTIYEPYVMDGTVPGWIQQYHRLSATGDKISTV